MSEQCGAVALTSDPQVTECVSEGSVRRSGSAADGQNPWPGRRLTRRREKRARIVSVPPTQPGQIIRKIQDMKILNFIHVMVARGFYSWAMKEINPMHPDVPRIMQRQRELEDKAQRIFA